MVYKPGASHHLPEFLSRASTVAPPEDIHDDIPCLALAETANGLRTGRYTGTDTPEPVEFDDVVEAQQTDDFCVEMSTRVERGTAKAFFRDEHHALYRRAPYGKQLVIPQSLRERVLTLELLQYFVTREVLGVLQRAKDTHASRQVTYKRAVHALLNEYLDGDDLVDHLQSLMQASQEKWEDEHEFANRILDANRALGSALQEAELKSILLKGVGREVRALGRNFNTQGRTFPKLRKFLAKTGAATQEARGVKLQAKPKGSTSRSVGGEEREPRRTRPAASVALPVAAASAAAALSVTDYGTKAERAE